MSRSKENGNIYTAKPIPWEYITYNKQYGQSYRPKQHSRLSSSSSHPAQCELCEGNVNKAYTREIYNLTQKELDYLTLLRTEPSNIHDRYYMCILDTTKPLTVLQSLMEFRHNNDEKQPIKDSLVVNQSILHSYDDKRGIHDDTREPTVITSLIITHDNDYLASNIQFTTCEECHYRILEETSTIIQRSKNQTDEPYLAVGRNRDEILECIRTTVKTLPIPRMILFDIYK